jgi:hypothetical protein
MNRLPRSFFNSFIQTVQKYDYFMPDLFKRQSFFGVVTDDQDDLPPFGGQWLVKDRFVPPVGFPDPAFHQVPPGRFWDQALWDSDHYLDRGRGREGPCMPVDTERPAVKGPSCPEQLLDQGPAAQPLVFMEGLPHQ